MDGPQPEPREAPAPEAAMHDAAPSGPGLSPLVDSRQSSQAAAEAPQHQQGSSHGTNGIHSPASAPSNSSHSTPGPQPLSLPLPPPPSSAPAPAPAPLASPGPVHRPSAPTPRPTPVPGPVSTGNSPVAGPYHSHPGHHHHHPQQPPLVNHYQQQPPPLNHGHQQLPSVNRGHQQQPPPMHQGKVAIVDPPRAARRASDTNFNALHSPIGDHARVNPKFNEDVSRLTHAIQQSLPEAVRRVTREHWEKTLLGSDFHQRFVMGAGFLHTNPVVLQQTVRESGLKMVSHAKRELIHHFEATDLDVVADAILAKASDEFLDKALEARLATIDARSLINALARNGRLGYESSEVDSNPAPAPAPATAQPAYPAQPAYHPQPAYPPQAAHSTHLPSQVQPSAMPNPSQPPAPSQRPHHPQHNQQVPAGSGGRRSLQCQLCWRKFQAESAYEFHTKKRVCTKVPPDANGFPFNCSFCGTGFVTAVGKNYHNMNKVCGDHGMAPATPRAPASPINLSSGSNSPACPVPPSATPNAAPPASQAVPAAATSRPVHQASPYQASPYQASPYQSSPAQASTPLPSQKIPNDDPYSHLKPATRAKLEEELRLAELSYRPRFEETAQIADDNERLKKLEGLQNSFSTKQSIIRKKYGVRLRQRRTKAEIDAERQRVTGHTTVYSRKRQRTDSDTPSGALPKTMDATPTPHLSVVDMNSAGLGGSGATAAMADPTAEQTPSRPAIPRNSLASYQRNGYRVNTHIPIATRPPSSHLQDVPMANTGTEAESRTQSPDPKRGSPADPIVLDGTSSDSETDTDEDIPATVPPGKAQSSSGARGLTG